ncbi:methionine adenosyltransferase [Carboxydichorda subterranea]|uniref:methionine adenosyltransferase n=1 Tax=Carboxydichorda subterranea TaxID=3109565 RepID=UPI003857484B
MQTQGGGAAQAPRRREFTSESVTEGHPDKVCDQIADAILDAIYEQDPDARVACEVATKTGMVLIMGEITTRARVDMPRIARKTILDIGYDDGRYGLDGATCSVLLAVEEQSPDIRQGVDRPWESREEGASRDGAGAAGADPYGALGAGDQGIMFGYATDETVPEFMPLPTVLAHRLARQLSRVRKEGVLPYLRPDGKTQVTVAYEDDRPVAVTAVVVSAQHEPDVALERLRSDIRRHVIDAVIPAGLLSPQARIFINPTGRFVVGGPQADTGMTGRKLIVDTYGGMSRHGGGAFSGKDATKVDRTASYAARYLAKNVVAAGLARRCEVQIAYVIGVARPISVGVDTFGTGRLPDALLEERLKQLVDLRPAALIERFDLRRPIYRPLAAYGHFGRVDLDLPWERIDLVDALRRAAAEYERQAAAPARAAAAAADERGAGR